MKCCFGFLLALLLSPVAFAQPAAGDLDRARQLLAAGRVDEAAAIYEKLLQARPDDPSLIVNLAVIEFKAGRYEKVIERCRQALQLAPGLTTASLFLGASYFQLGKPAEAVEPLQVVVAAQPKERNARLMLAESLLLLERYREAAGHFHDAAVLLPENPRVWYGMERSYHWLGGQAKQQLERSAPDSAYVYALSGDAYLERQQYGGASHYFRKALNADSRLPGIHASLANVYRAAGRLDWAAKEEESVRTSGADFLAGRHREAALAAGDAPETLYWKAKACNELASRAYGRLAALPPSSELHELKARTLDSRARYFDAAKEWREALELAPKSTVLEKGLAVSLYNGRDLAAALPLLEELVKREPGSAEFGFLVGSSLLQLEQPVKAVSFLERALKVNSGFLQAQGALGEAYLKMGEPAKAIACLKAALAADEDGSRHFQLARAYRAMGEREIAAQTLAQYRRLRGAWETKRRELEANFPIAAPD